MLMSMSGAWIEDPQIIVEKDFVENNKIFREVCGYNADQGQSATAKTAPVPIQRDFGIRRFNAAVRSGALMPPEISQGREA